MTKLTRARKLWLQHLSENGPTKRASNRIGFDCMKAGWTEWDYRLADGTTVSFRDLWKQFGHDWWERIPRPDMDRITVEGQAVLDESKVRRPRKKKGLGSA
jgi:hypothetical protein